MSRVWLVLFIGLILHVQHVLSNFHHERHNRGHHHRSGESNNGGNGNSCSFCKVFDRSIKNNFFEIMAIKSVILRG